MNRSRKHESRSHWKLHVGLYCQNIGSKVVGHVRVALYFEFVHFRVE